MRISDWGSDVCSSDLGEKNGAAAGGSLVDGENAAFGTHAGSPGLELQLFLFVAVPAAGRGCRGSATRSMLFDLGKRRTRPARLVFLHWLPCGDGPHLLSPPRWPRTCAVRRRRRQRSHSRTAP